MREYRYFVVFYKEHSGLQMLCHLNKSAKQLLKTKYHQIFYQDITKCLLNKKDSYFIFKLLLSAHDMSTERKMQKNIYSITESF